MLQGASCGFPCEIPRLLTTSLVESREMPRHIAGSLGDATGFPGISSGISRDVAGSHGHSRETSRGNPPWKPMRSHGMYVHTGSRGVGAIGLGVRVGRGNNANLWNLVHRSWRKLAGTNNARETGSRGKSSAVAWEVVGESRQVAGTIKRDKLGVALIPVE